ncbi:MAG: hypothetical protein DMF91_15350 [Acidobacteria bacterium]|nr:MAG: hypothetical protein DMF91_15350 [Acidobacteriota bacterium]
MMLRAIAAFALALAAITAADPAYIKDVEAWRAKHEADYRRDWASIDGLFFLKPGENRAGSARTNSIVLSAAVPASIGSFFLENGKVRFEPHAGVAISRKDQPVTVPLDLIPDSGKEPADELVVNGVRIVVHGSGDRLAIRVRDANGAMARAFLGFRWFPIDERYRVTARFIKDPAPRELKIPNTLGDVDTYTTEGVVEFSLNGQTLRMRPMTTRPKRFYFVFRDASSGHETYAAARFLYSDLRDDGTTVLDFNEAYNPPCAFNPYTTCPIPPKENRLKVKILAGEQAYPHEPKARTP